MRRARRTAKKNDSANNNIISEEGRKNILFSATRWATASRIDDATSRAYASAASLASFTAAVRLGTDEARFSSILDAAALASATAVGGMIEDAEDATSRIISTAAE